VLHWVRLLKASLLLLAVLGGCKPTPRRPDAGFEATAPDPHSSARKRQVAPVSAVLRPIEAPIVPESRGRERCPDELLSRAAADSVLAVRVHDLRADRRELLPLELSLALETARPAAVETDLGERPRFVADLLVDVYSNPRLFRRLNALHSEWAAGRLEGRLVVRDERERRALCQVPLKVRGSAADAPISRRLREGTRAALETKLYRAVNQEMRVALSGISGVLRLAEPASGVAGKTSDHDRNHESTWLVARY
jgi:hypothetical protein